MKTSLKTGAAQIFSCCPQNTRELENLPGVGAAAPPSPHGLYAPLNETKKQLRSSYLLVEDKPHFLPPASEVCHA